MAVLVHGLEGRWPQQWLDEDEAWLSLASGCRVRVVAPRLEHRRAPQSWAGEVEAGHRAIREAVAQARGGGACKPAVYYGAGRGGYAALHAAQRDPQAGYVVAAQPYLVDAREGPHEEAEADAWWAQGQREAVRLLAERSRDCPRGWVLRGTLDQAAGAGVAEALHRQAGGPTQLEAAGPAQCAPGGWRALLAGWMRGQGGRG